LEEIESVIGPVETPEHAYEDAIAAPAPGMLTKHYAPRTPLTILADSSWQSRLSETTAGSRRIGLLTFTLGRQALAERCASIEILSRQGDLREAAAGFFAALRRLDALDLDEILATPFPDEGLGRALNDRLRRATAR